VTSFELAALSRADIPEEKRADFHLYIDEFHNFETDSFATILSEARKYHLHLTLSHQYMDQLRPSVRDAVFGNVGAMIAFRVGGRDAKMLAEEFNASIPASAFSSLGNYEILVKALSDGQHQEPFRGHSLAPIRIRSG
jgi:type IV secretory pathway TraG/TraD family ATPase VirD4